MTTGRFSVKIMNMDKSGTEQVYAFHHRSRNRLGTSAFLDYRGNYLRQNIGSGKNILDIGCRDGVLTATYADGNNVTGLDIDEDALKRASTKLGIKTIHADLNNEWGVEDGSFDVVVAGEVLEHLYYPNRVISKVKRAMKSDGLFVGSVPNAFSLRNRLRLLFAAKRNTPLADPTHINHFSRRELENILKDNFVHVSVEPLGRFPWLDHIFPGLFCFMLLFKASGKKP